MTIKEWFLIFTGPTFVILGAFCNVYAAKLMKRHAAKNSQNTLELIRLLRELDSTRRGHSPYICEICDKNCVVYSSLNTRPCLLDGRNISPIRGH